MASPHSGIGHELAHYGEELLETAGEFAYEVIMPPRQGHGFATWILFWISLVVVVVVGAYTTLSGVKLPVSPTWGRMFRFLYTTAPIWFPMFSLRLFIDLWMKYIRLDYIKKAGEVLLEIRVPKIIEKTPKAMELFFMAMYETGAVEYNETYWDGKVRPWFSYEIASFGGDVHFYVWTSLKYRNVLEAQLYAQYPTVELIEVPDYMKQRVYDSRNFMWGTYFVLQKPDPYPIMTYVDYGLDKETEEEYKVDPLSTLIEYLGSIKKGEEVWIQILAQAYKMRGLKEGQLHADKDWIAEGEREINKIMKRDPRTKSARKVTEAGFPIIPTLSDSEKKQVEAIGLSLEKRPFWCTARLLYHADKEVFHLRSATVSGLLGTFRKPFNSNLLNGFKLGWYTDISDPTKDWLFIFGLKNWAMNKFIPRYARYMLDAFRRRSFFYPPYRNWHSKPYILTSEELATIFHIPGGVVTTPTFERIPSKKVEPPANLPV